MKIINSKIFKGLVLLYVLGFLIGVITFFILSNKDSNIINYFNLIKSSDYNYLNGLFNSIIYNLKFEFFIWICGLLFIFSPIIPFILIFRGISLAFTLITIIYTFKIKGLILSLILLFPCTIINEAIYLFTSYYALNFSIKTFNIIKNNKTINLKHYIKNYLYQFLIFIIVLLLSSLIEIYITSNIFKFVL